MIHQPTKRTTRWQALRNEVRGAWAIGALALVVLMCVAQARLPVARAAPNMPDAFGKTPTLKPATADEVRQLALAWLDKQIIDGQMVDGQKVDAATRARAEALWRAEAVQSAAAGDLLDRLAATLALADKRARSLVEMCSKPRARGPLPAQDWLADEATPPLLRNNLRLYYGRWLAHQFLYDESLAQLSGVQPADVIDPAALLFYTSVAHHRLLNKKEGLESTARLLSDVVAPPQRYVAVAQLMQEDLKALEDDSLDHVSRRMDDIRRRLDLGRAGQKVRKVEDGVVASLDKLIEDLEKQQQQQQASGNGGGPRPTQPMQDSQLARQNAAGDVQRRKVGATAGWGNLPAKEREEAMQQIGKDFPSHYREVIEQYFRKLASEESGEKK
jgi:hypothetical protein